MLSPDDAVGGGDLGEEAVEARQVGPVDLVVGDHAAVGRLEIHGRGRVGQDRTLNPRWAASRVVVSQHIWVMKPETITCSIPSFRRCSSRGVPVNATGRCFRITGSPGFGATAGWISSAGSRG